MTGNTMVVVPVWIICICRTGCVVGGIVIVVVRVSAVDVETTLPVPPDDGAIVTGFTACRGCRSSSSESESTD